MPTIKRNWAFVALCLIFAVCWTPALAQDKPGFEPVMCWFDVPRGQKVDCGYVTVPEDRSNPESPTLRLAVAIYHSTSDHPAPDPVVLLVGGPGASALEYPDYTFRPNYREFLKKRDFILYDQRGVGLSRPSLDCPNLTSAYFTILTQPHTPDEMTALEYQALDDCRQALIKNGVNLESYTSAASAADLNDLRIALGYQQWNLFGVSYGTRLALTAMRDDPEGIRSVILDSVYPPQSDLFTELPAHQKRAFDLLFAACKQDEACHKAYPDLVKTFYTLVQYLNDHPMAVKVNGVPKPVYVNGNMLANSVFSMLYDKRLLPMIPRFIEHIRDNTQFGLVPVAQDYLNYPFGVSEGIYYTIECGEEVRFSSLDKALASGTVLDPSVRAGFQQDMRRLYGLCQSWGAKPADPMENQPVTSSIPTLVLSGENDPITPPAWGQLVAQTLNHSFFFALPGVGHGVVRSETCGVQLALAFLDDTSSQPDSSCIAEIPKLTFDTF